MPDEKIEVEWIATANQMLNVINKIDDRMMRQEQLMKKLGDTSSKAADGAAGSFNKLEKELKENEAQLKKLAIGTKEFDEQRKKVDKLRTSLNGAKNELSNAGGGISSMFSGAIGKMGALAAGMMGFQAVISAVVSELEKTKQLKLEAAATSRTFEQSLADVGQNIGGDQVANARKMILEQAPKLGVTQEGLADILGIGISAGAKDLQEAMALATAALKLTVGDAEKAKALVGGTLDVASLGGSTNFEGALGQLLQTQSQVRSTNLSEFGKAIGPGLAAATADGSKQKGVSTERALEMGSVISQIIKDQAGSNTATTMRYLFNRMSNFVPQSSVKLDDGGTAKVSSAQIKAFNALNTFDERLKMMQDIPAIGQQFLETQRESIGKTAISEIIGKSARAVAFEEKAKENITSIDDAQGFFKKLEGALEGETALLQVDRKSAANIAAAEVIGDRDVEGTVQKIVDDTIAKVNLSGIDYETSGKIRNQMRLDNMSGVGSIDSGVKALEEAKGNRRVFGILPVGGSVSPEDKALIDRQIEALNALRIALEAQAKNQPQPQRQAQQAVRPREAPLPGAIAP